MAFSVTDFKSNLKQGGARSALFSVDLKYPSFLSNSPTKSQFFVKSTSLPSSTVGTYDVFYHGKAIKVAGDRSFDTWETNIINDEDFQIRIALEEWVNHMGNRVLNSRSKELDKATSGSPGYEGFNSQYKKEISVTQFAKNGKGLFTYTFKGAFPTTVAAIPLDWGSADIEEYSVTWSYDSWERTTAKSTETVIS